MRRAIPVPWSALLGAVLVAAVYLPFVGNGFLYDDRAVVLRAQVPRSAGEVAALLAKPYYETLPYYRPLTSATFLIQRHLHGDEPVAFHLLNVVLGSAAVLAAYALLRLPTFGIGPVPAALAATLFALHPVASSCILPVSGRDTLLAAIAVMVSLNALCRPGARSYAIGLIAFAIGLLSKEMTVVLPGLLLLADLCRVSDARPGPGVRAWALRYAPIVAVVAVYLVVRGAVLEKEHYPWGSLPDVPLSYLYALQVTLAPFPDLRYEPAVVVWWSWGRLAVALAIAVALGFLAWRSGSHRGSTALFWGGWIVLTFLPTSNLVWQETRFDERYVFLSALAPFAIAAGAASALYARPSVRRATVAAGLGLGAALGALSVARGPYWEEEAFYRQWLRYDPVSVKAHYNLANSLERRGRGQEAVVEYEEALRLDPGHAKAQYGLGTLLLGKGEVPRATPHLEAAVRLEPESYAAQNNLGSALAMAGRMEEAAARFAESVRLNPGFGTARSNLGRVLASLGRLDEAERELREALRIVPDQADARLGLGTVLLRKGRRPEAIVELREALRLRPDLEAARAALREAETGGP